MNQSAYTTDILIIGAGITGLIAGYNLNKSGKEVLVVDKSRGVGGRMATRRIGDASFDHGANFLYATDPDITTILGEWHEQNLIKPWYTVEDPEAGEIIRYQGTPSMTSVPKQIAKDLCLLKQHRVISVQKVNNKWFSTAENGDTITADTVIITSPLPQTLAILKAGNIPLPENVTADLEQVEYQRCLVVLAVLNDKSSLKTPGIIEPKNSPIALLIDNQVKGISKVPAITIQATPAYSLNNWNRDRTEVGKELIKVAGEWVNIDVSEFQVHGWLYSRPVVNEKKYFLIAQKEPELIIAGESFVGPTLESAILSGLRVFEQVR